MYEDPEFIKIINIFKISNYCISIKEKKSKERKICKYLIHIVKKFLKNL